MSANLLDMNAKPIAAGDVCRIKPIHGDNICKYPAGEIVEVLQVTKAGMAIVLRASGEKFQIPPSLLLRITC